ncbi:hypothetical protein LUZ60_011411 [Juncus effusus]|nr:hypothetical protein LUZ60_011411 [Juncus effusus]
MASSNNRFQSESKISSENKAPITPITSPKPAIFSKGLNHVLPAKQFKLTKESTNDVVFFLLKLGILETVRRVSTAKCPFVWSTVQALQVLNLPLFKWIHRWTPIGFLVKGIQKFSKPLLLLSVTTALADCSKSFDNSDDESNEGPDSASSSRQDTSRNSNESTEEIVRENWIVQLFGELEKQGITLPERIDEGELRRFHSASDGNLPNLISSLKKTIKWRETYHILSFEELNMWSHLVFWHGCDVMLRPCLVIRLGSACSSLDPQDRPRFAQAIVSQIEHGITCLVNQEDPRITVLMDCKGISPFRFPMQMLRYVTMLVQENYPNRLGQLVVVRLPPIMRVITQTFIQVLKAPTRQKMRLEGDSYQKALTEILQSIPAFLGGNCNCTQCLKILGKLESKLEEYCSTSKSQSFQKKAIQLARDEPGPGSMLAELHEGSDCNNVLRPVILGFLMLWIVIAFFAGMSE